MHPVDTKKLVEGRKAEASSVVAARVLEARKIQKERFCSDGIFCNAEMGRRHIERYCPLDPECKALMEEIINSKGLSARAYSRIIKLARTIADLDGVEKINTGHLSEAAGYRFLDKMDLF